MPDAPDPVPTADPPPADLTGRTVGDFHVLRKLGQGGMGQVYLARQQSLKREVALKILSSHLADNPTALKRFQAEAEAVARVTHANIVQVYAIGEHDGLRYMALEYVDGRNLKDYLARKGPPELPVALTILRQVAAALQRASELGIVHRDIKPENIMVTRKVEVKVADFGLSRFFAGEGKPVNLTQSGMTLGTPLYMSPEQVQGHPVDHRSDLYSFGVTCYHLLAGHPPFRGNTAFEIAVQHVQKEPPPLAAERPDLPADLCGLVHKLLAKRADDRYQTARDVIRDLARIQKGLPPAAPPTVTSVPAVPVVAPSSPSAVAPTMPSSTSTAALPVAQPPGGGWVARGLVGTVLAAAAGGLGWWAFGHFRPSEPDARGTTSPGGLPDVRPPEVLTTTRERELTAKMRDRSAKVNEVVDAALELVLVQVRERRLDDADRVLDKLRDERGERPAGPRAQDPDAVLVALAERVGRAVVLAHRDRAKESNDLFQSAAQMRPPIPPKVGPVAPKAPPTLDAFLIEHPVVGEAVAEALHRNAENGDVRKPLDWLRTPAGLVKGPKN